MSKQLATASPEQKIGAGENVISTPIPHQGARPKVIVTKNVANVSVDHTDEDWISADETMSSTFSSTKANKGTQSPVSLVSSEEKPKGVGFEGEKGKSCLKNLGRGRSRSTGRSLSRSLSPSPARKRESKSSRKEGEKGETDENIQGRKRGRGSPPSSDPDSDNDKKKKDGGKKPGKGDDGDKGDADESRTPSPKKKGDKSDPVYSQTPNKERLDENTNLQWVNTLEGFS